VRVAIIGGGLAGCAAAFELKRRGHEPVIYEAGESLASAASGNAIGLYNPRFGAEWSPQSQYYAAAFERALDVFAEFDDIDFDPCGALHLITDEKKARRFGKMIESWPSVEMRLVNVREASAIAGVEVGCEALYLPQSGRVSPPKLCAAYSDGVEVHCHAKADDIDADIIVLAAGAAMRGFDEASSLDLGAVRGQVTMIKEAAPLKANICYGGYISSAVDGAHMVGSTFQRWLDHSEIIDQDDADNLEKLYAALPSFPRELEVVGRRAAVRTTSRDHFPVVGSLSDKVYVSTAHGSHGILSSLMAAEVLGCMIDNKPQPLSDDVNDALSPHRFKD